MISRKVNLATDTFGREISGLEGKINVWLCLVSYSIPLFRHKFAIDGVDHRSEQDETYSHREMINSNTLRICKMEEGST